MIDKKRLATICEQMKAANDKQRSVAASKASALLDAYGMSWSEIIMAAPTESPAPTERFANHMGMNASRFLSMIEPRGLPAFDKQFVRSLNDIERLSRRAGRELELSTYQWAILVRIAITSGSIVKMGAA